jgi:hypothetical protein
MTLLKQLKPVTDVHRAPKSEVLETSSPFCCISSRRDGFRLRDSFFIDFEQNAQTGLLKFSVID